MNTLHLAYKYVAHRAAVGALNPRSAEQARSRLADFAGHVPEDPWQVTARHVQRWMERPDLAPNYRRGRLSSVRGFCRWCVANGYMRTDPTLLVEPPKIPPALPKRLTHGEAVAMCEAAPDNRTLLILLLMLHLGLRRVEVARLCVEDLDFAERSVTVRGKGGHGQETDALPVTQECWSVLIRYLDETGACHGPLVRSVKNPERGLSAQYVSELVRRVMVDSGVKRPGDRLRTPHSTRHTTAHDLLSKTHDVRAVQQALRHRSVRSTEVYLRGHVTELREVLEGRTYLPAL